MRSYTIGYIEHDSDVHSKYLAPSLYDLIGQFDVITTSDKNYPAKNYNEIKDKCKTDYLILTHQDVSFPCDLLFFINKTIDTLSYMGIDFGVLGMVGMNPHENYLQHWCSSKRIWNVDTLDCCFAVINPKDKAIFDEENFGEYHLYVEDYCAQMNRIHGKQNFTILIDSNQEDSNHNEFRKKITHHGSTVNKLGFCWGRYNEFKSKLIEKWGPIKTT